MRIFHKGLLLIGVPLLLELLVVGVLIFQIHSSQAETERISHTRQLLRLGTALSNAYFDCGFGLSQICMAFVPTPRQNAVPDWNYARPDAFVQEDYDYIRSQIKPQIVRYRTAVAQFPIIKSSFLELVKGSRTEAAAFDPILQQVDESFVEFDEISRWLDKDFDENNQLRIKHLKGSVESNLTPWVEAIKHASVEAHEIDKSSPTVLAARRNSIKLSLYAALATTVLVAIALAKYFSSDIVGRLQILKVNAFRLQNQESLLPLVTGKDEITSLDRSFHDMALALNEAARKERAILSYVRDVIFSMDKEFVFSRLSPAVSQQWQFEPEALAGKNLFDVVLPEDHDQTRAALARLSQPGTEAVTFENRVCKANGQLIDTLWSVSHGTADSAYYGVAYDITERKAVERLKQEFMAMVSHDLRAPLTSVVAVQKLLTTGLFGPLPEQALLKVTEANNNVNRLLSLINDLLDIEKLEAGKMVLNSDVAPLQEVVTRSFESVQALAQAKNINLRNDVTNLTAKAEGDRIVQVVVNLVSNAIKFSPPNSTVSVSAYEQADQVVIEVMDHGRGIPESHLNAVFERYRQVKQDDGKRRSGTGLGLAICKLIVENHGGTISVRSREGEGSTFVFTLPLATDVVPII